MHRRRVRFEMSRAIPSYRGDTPFMVDDHLHWQAHIIAHCSTESDARLIAQALNAWWESVLMDRSPHVCEGCCP